MKGVKVALPGYDALTDSNPAHFSLFVDGSADHVLVKEKSRATTSIDAFSEATIAHGLSYFPFNMVMVEVSSGEFQWQYNGFGGSFNPFYSYVTTSNLVMGNQDSSARSFTDIIFHDQL